MFQPDTDSGSKESYMAFLVVHELKGEFSSSPRSVAKEREASVECDLNRVAWTRRVELGACVTVVWICDHEPVIAVHDWAKVEGTLRVGVGEHLRAAAQNFRLVRYEHIVLECFF